ncbi:MAG: hypothetical protein WA775_11230 [Psychroserpens sp.]|uniref:hypothetical protein n=1 Tax=Psychroserpens sp. TaxID=2020870 RepID=UPI003C730801
MNSNIKYEALLGKTLMLAQERINCTFSVVNSEFYAPDYNMFSNEPVDGRNYFGMYPKRYSLSLNNKKLVKSIIMHFDNIMSDHTFNALVEVYGEPDKTLVIHDRKLKQENTLINEDIQIETTVKTHELDLREGAFTDKPLFIIWEKNDYKMTILLKHKSNSSMIVFNKKDL